MRLLAVDWDYFFPDLSGSGNDPRGLYDWGHRETPFFIEAIWGARATSFLVAGQSLPGLTGEQRRFWERFTISPQATVYTAESNAMAAHPDVVYGVTEVHLYDAHHDAGYYEKPARRWDRELAKLCKAGIWHCDNWMLVYAACAARLHVRYPAWKTWALENDGGMLLPPIMLDRQIDPGGPVPGTFDRVFICRSGAWVPPWLDKGYERFVQRVTRKHRHVELQPTPRRKHDPQVVTMLAKDIINAREKWAYQHPAESVQVRG